MPETAREHLRLGAAGRPPRDAARRRRGARRARRRGVRRADPLRGPGPRPRPRPRRRGLDYTAHPTALDALRRVCARVARAVRRARRRGRAPRRPARDRRHRGRGRDDPAHRGEAFAASRALIDTLKAEVPIWKHQQFADGTEEWVGTSLRRPGREGVGSPTCGRSGCLPWQGGDPAVAGAAGRRRRSWRWPGSSGWAARAAARSTARRPYAGSATRLGQAPTRAAAAPTPPRRGARPPRARAPGSQYARPTARRAGAPVARPDFRGLRGLPA